MSEKRRRIGRNGDVLVFHKTNIDDSIGEALLPFGAYRGYHCSPFLVGRQFDKESIIASKNHRYLMFFDSILPEDYVFSILKHSKYVDRIGIVYRTSPKNISGKEMYKAYKKWDSYPEIGYTVKIEKYILGWFRSEQSYGKYIKTNVCSVNTNQMLSHLGLVFRDDPYHNVIPQDFVDLQFYQSEEYKKCRIRKNDL